MRILQSALLVPLDRDPFGHTGHVCGVVGEAGLVSNRCWSRGR